MRGMNCHFRATLVWPKRQAVRKPPPAAAPARLPPPPAQHACGPGLNGPDQAWRTLHGPTPEGEAGRDQDSLLH